MRSLFSAIGTIVLTASLVAAVELAPAQPHLSYEVLVPTAVAVNAATDRVVITARASLATELTEACTGQPGAYPAHNAVIDGEEETSIAGLIVVSPEGLRAGTVLGDLVQTGSCTDNGIEYAKFVGIVK